MPADAGTKNEATGDIGDIIYIHSRPYFFPPGRFTFNEKSSASRWRSGSGATNEIPDSSPGGIVHDAETVEFFAVLVDLPGGEV